MDKQLFQLLSQLAAVLRDVQTGVVAQVDRRQPKFAGEPLAVIDI